jgi:hypothetical protein
MRLDHMSEKEITILSKQCLLFVTKKQDLLTFVSIVCLENNVESSLAQVSTKYTAHWIISIQIFGVLLRFHQRVVLDIL